MTTIKRKLICYKDKKGNRRVFVYFPEDILDGIRFDKEKNKKVEMWNSKNTIYIKVLTEISENKLGYKKGDK